MRTQFLYSSHAPHRLEVSGELDVSNRTELAEALAALHENESTRPCVVDLADVPFIDSTIVGVLVEGALRCRERGHELEVVAEHPMVVKVLALTSAEAVLTVRRPSD